jgi:uncharacterized protein involved in exopolysaccharide biosynthesis
MTKRTSVETHYDARRPPSYRETFRRHRGLLCLPIVLSVLVASYVVIGKPPVYSSTASLWVDTPPPTPSTIGANAPAMAQTPATAEQILLSELMSTRSFARAVAAKSPLGRQADVDTDVGFAKLAASLSRVSSNVAGPQVLQISYSGPSAAVAGSTLAAVVDELQRQSKEYANKHNGAVRAHYRDQVVETSQALARARDRVTAYLNAHPRAGESDPNLTALTAAQATAAEQLAQARTDQSEAAGGRNGGWATQVIDEPSRPVQVSGGKKKLAMMILAGLIGGGLVSFLGVVALTPGKRDPWEDEMFPVDLPGDELSAADPWESEVPAAEGGRRLVVPWSGPSGDVDKP